MYELTVKPKGDLVDALRWEAFADLMNNVSLSLDGVLILDLACVNRIASNYIGSIISAFKQIEGESSAKIINVRPHLYELLGVLHLTEILHIEALGDCSK